MHSLEGCLLSAELPTEHLVVICRFKEGQPVPQNPAVHFQVTVRKDKCSTSGRFIRFGETPNDEIMGWQRRDLIEVCEVLGVLQEDGQTVIHIKDLPVEQRACA